VAATDPCLRRFFYILLVIPLLVWFVAFAQTAFAEDYGIAQFYTHAFSNDTVVYTGVFALNKDLDLRTSVYAKYTVDLINPDFGEGDEGGDDRSLRKNTVKPHAVSSASAANAAGSNSDTRNEITVGVTRDFDGLFGVEFFYDFSYESDYLSNTPTITLKKDLFSKNTTLTFSFSRNFDWISGKFLPENGTRNTNNFFFGITQILSPRMLARAGFSLSKAKGEMSEGIRLVPLDGTASSSCTAISATCVGESLPDSRTRRAYIFDISRYFTGGLGGVLYRAALKFTYRYYKDDWDIRSHMGEIEYLKYVGDRFLVDLNYRYYVQTEAFFVKDTYTASDRYKSASPQFESFETDLVGLKGTYFLETGDRSKALEAKYQFYHESTGVFANVFMASFRFNY